MLEKYIFYYILIILVISCYSKQIEDINNICKKISIKHTSPHNTVNDFLKSINYNFDKIKKSKISEISYNFLFGNNFEEIEEFQFFGIVKYYLLNAYILPIIILWIIFIILFFKRQFIFKPSFHFEIIPKFYQNIIIINLFFFIFILSIVILSKIKDLNSSMNEAFCNLLKFFYELNHGKIKEKEMNNIHNNNHIKENNNNNFNKNDLWPGLYELNSILLDSSDAINKIAVNENKTFLFLKEIDSYIKEYKNLIKSLSDTASKKIPNPNFYQDYNILTRYSYEFNDISRANSFINVINNEFIRYFQNATELMKSLDNYCNDLSKKNDFYDIELNNFYENISDFSSVMKETSFNITNNIILFQEHAQIILLMVKILNIFSFLFALFIVFIFIMQINNKYFTWIKLALNISWNFTFLLIIFNIFFCYFFNNLGDINYNIIYILENDILNTESNIFFNTCLNSEKSDLIEVLNLYDEKKVLIDIDKYYKNIFPIYDSLNNLEQEIPKLENIKIISKNFDNYLNNYEISTNSTYKNSDVSFVLKEITKITNNFDKNISNFFCESEDIWVSSKKRCQNYKYISRYEIKNKFERKKNEKYCFIIQDNYKESDLKSIYKNICPERAYNQIVRYVQGLTKYYNSNENLLNSLEKIFKEVERYNKKLSSMIINQIKNCQNDIIDLIDIYNPILGKENITNLFKCEGLKRKIINFYDINYNKIIYYCKFNKIYILVIIILQILGNVCIIINNKEGKEMKRKYLKIQHKDLNNDGVELIEEVPGEDEDI